MFEIVQNEDSHVVLLRGDLDESAAGGLLSFLDQRLARARPQALYIDLSDCGEVGAAPLSRIQDYFVRREMRLHFVNARPTVRSMLEEKGFTNAVLERRSFYRLPCEIPCALRAEEGPPVPGTVVNLSGRGCAVRVGADQTVRPGKAAVSFTLPGSGAERRLPARVGSVRLTPGGKLLGVSFEGIGPREEAELVQYIVGEHRRQGAAAPA